MKRGAPSNKGMKLTKLSAAPFRGKKCRLMPAPARRLSEIHGAIAGRGPGHKHNVEVLNKSAVVLLVACWEAYVEDLAVAAFARLLAAAAGPSAIPAKVLALAARPLREDQDERKVWSLAGDGWKAVLHLLGAWGVERGNELGDGFLAVGLVRR